MSFFKKLFSSPKPEQPKRTNLEFENLPVEQVFVKKFVENQGKFLYCTSLAEVTENIANIIKENSWEEIVCNDYDLQKLIKSVKVKTSEKLNNKKPLFVSCEHLIAENGSILFSSNQLKDSKISELSENFIVYATTSQLVKTKGESLAGIKTRYKGNIPSNISAIKRFNPSSKDDDFMSYGNTNSKNLYLLLFEDL
ncbi:LUD domain-containing protein [Lutibacter holmesii]|uniref:LUD domain-containing protein n=1 Tax=Lutibacter holmesii TaxID=1137985 RepID=A0ABW3WML0_9FLAO